MADLWEIMLIAGLVGLLAILAKGFLLLKRFWQKCSSTEMLADTDALEEPEDVESLRMLVQIVETHSTERAEQRAKLLIDLMNSDDGRKYIDEKVDTSKRLITEKLVRLVLLMSKKLYDHIANLPFKSTSLLLTSLLQLMQSAEPGIGELDKLVLELLNKKFMDNCAVAVGISPRSSHVLASNQPDLDVVIGRMVESRMSAQVHLRFCKGGSFGIVEQLLFELANTRFHRTTLELTKHLQSAMFFQAVQCMGEIRQLISNNSWIDDNVFPLSPSSMHFVLTKASGVLENKSLSGKDMMNQLWNGIMQNMSETSGDITMARANLETFLKEQRENNAITQRIKPYKLKQLQKTVRDDFEKGLQLRQKRVEKYLNSVHDHLRALKDKLTRAQGSVINQRMSRLAGILKPVIPQAAAETGSRFQRRSKPNWFDETETFLFEYIRGNKEDDEFKQFLVTEELYADLPDISEKLTSWINETYKSVDKLTFPMLKKEGIIAEIKRTWAFTRALLLNDVNDVRLHSELVKKTINAACSTDGNSKMSPVISMGSLRLFNNDELALKFVTGSGADVTKIEAFVRHTVEIAGGTIHNVSHYTRNREIVFTIKFAEGYNEESVRKCVQHIVSNLSELAELHVCIAMLGNYDITSGTKLTNPAFNRIYGNGVSAPGFQSSFREPRNYGDEMYFCPVGWKRIGLKVAQSAAEFDRKYNGWHVAYHGTKHELAATILTSGFVAGPEAYSDEEGVVYMTPSIVYASNPRYSQVYEVKDSSGNKTYVQMVLQLRVNPANIWKKRPGLTLFGDDPPPTEAAVDPNFPNNENLEWLVKPIPGMNGMSVFHNAFVVYGIMIRDSKTDPRTHPEPGQIHEDRTQEDHTHREGFQTKFFRFLCAVCGVLAIIASLYYSRGRS